MRLALSRARLFRAQAQIAEQSRGNIPAVFHFGAGRATDMTVENTSRLPVLFNNTSLQNSDGSLRFIFGYSELGGTDVLG